MRRERLALTEAPRAVDVSIRNGVVRIYTRIEGPVFLRNCVELPRDDFRALVAALTEALQRLDRSTASDTDREAARGFGLVPLRATSTPA